MTGRLFCYYGDDFTGSTDALEVLAANGVPTVLFLDPPDEHLLARFPDCRAIGIAGESRSRSPEWMSRHLPPVFEHLRSYGATVCQYKVCSTFDSGPATGSIGRALEIGRRAFYAPFVPIAAAAPHLGRYVAFGNLFASGGGTIHRIDRHPTMSRHPVTPMHESDLRLHLARQTDAAILLLDLTALRGSNPSAALDAILARHPAAVLFDGIDANDIAALGRLLWTLPGGPPPFAIGSSGLTSAFIHSWREAGLIPAEFTPPAASPADRVLVVSGSCSPVTAGQIRHALANGFAGIRINPAAPDLDAALSAAFTALVQGRSVVLFTALGREDRVPEAGGEALGARLGALLRQIIDASGVRRVLIAGGDTASHAVRHLGIHALTFAGLLAPGAPLCLAHGAIPLDLVLKGGQIGPEDFFVRVKGNNP